ncbi:hypothetical protein RND71_025058 [Anisodus tanguticus]|uniref:Uncharacterized protein n=1 Tax=Anisodus tanguticus TaxID=243964 RepID=A0AAE1RSC4_9SOLA|nr:hypothetical protein RND71_025058 [Anisodus tanguticus]
MNQLASAKAIYWFREVKRVADSLAKKAFVNDEEQELYAWLVTRSPVALEGVVDGGRAKYNSNGKHVWARKYVKKTNPTINFVHPLQTNVPVWNLVL